MIPSTQPAKQQTPEARPGSESDKGSAANPARAQMGEGSYEGTRDYQKSIKDYLEEADVQCDAKAAKPESAVQAEEMERAEQAGKSHSRAPGK